MTRQEQIENEASKCYRPDFTHKEYVVNAFKEGVKWADEHPSNSSQIIEKIKNNRSFESFKNILDYTPEDINPDDGIPYEEVANMASDMYYLLKEIINDLTISK